MKESRRKHSHFEIKDVLAILSALESGNVIEQLNDLKDDDRFQPLIDKINSINKMFNDKKQMEQQLDTALEMITKLARLDFDHAKIEQGDTSEPLYALTLGLDMLSEELKHSVVSRAELDEQKKILDEIVDNIPVAITLKDPSDNFRIKLWNKAAEKIFEVPREMVLGKTSPELLSEMHVDLNHTSDAKICQEGILFDIPDETVFTRNKKLVSLHTRKVPIRMSENSQTSYLIGIWDDITLQKKSQEKLMQSSKMSSLGEMAGGIAHEINNPLAIIMGKVGILRKSIQRGDFDQDKILETLSKIEMTTERIAKIIKGLRSFSRNADNDPMIQTKLITIIEDTLEFCRERFKNHSIELQVKCDPKILIECRPAQISQILVNLLSNAHDAVEKLPKKWVTIEAKAELNSVKLIISDSGPGIRPEIIDKIMFPFFTTKAIDKGTGLGLSISKGIAETHHGHLYYDTLSKNTTFILELLYEQPSLGREKRPK